MIPIYEQIMEQIKLMIKRGELHENDVLPSVRVLSKELKPNFPTAQLRCPSVSFRGMNISGFLTPVRTGIF